MKLVAYTALHYGLDYLAYAIRSVIQHVDEYWVLYAPEGSHGTRTTTTCPETRDQLFQAALSIGQGKLHWVDGDWTAEGLQRDSILNLVPNADAILVLDADEIWPWQTIASVRLTLENGGTAMRQRCWRLPMIHYWRSFRRAVLHDPAWPIRVILPAVETGEIAMPGVKPINHMGYAMRTELVRYKWLIHGHRSQLRHDIDWFKQRWEANAQRDCHPVGSEYWNPEPVNFSEYMPKWMVEHPFANLEVIP